jgi:hypothetical protein
MGSTTGLGVLATRKSLPQYQSGIKNNDFNTSLSRVNLIGFLVLLIKPTSNLKGLFLSIL